jgi:hypothetical protein
MSSSSASSASSSAESDVPEQCGAVHRGRDDHGGSPRESVELEVESLQPVVLCSALDDHAAEPLLCSCDVVLELLIGCVCAVEFAELLSPLLG